jgi:acyl-CoA reductase-like NAD-dependent aldehyde dehydrogenase
MEAASAQQTRKAPQDGASTNGTGAADSFEVRRPADGSVIRTVATDGPDQVRETVERVRAEQPAWEALGFAGRRRWMERWRDWMISNHDLIADVMQAESGKVRADSELEAPYLCDAINFYCERGPEFLADETVSPHNPALKLKRVKVVFRPQPVVGIISPWNFPLILSAGDAVPALVAGCAVVIKPSHFTPLALIEIARAWREELGAPDVFAVVNGGRETGEALIDEVDCLQFTGSEKTGKSVMKRAADTLTPVTLELGGKDPMIVTRDADVERAVNAAAFGGLMNTGQICMSIERVYVEEPLYDEFVRKLTGRVESLRQGDDGREFTAEVGAMTTSEQLEIVEDHVEDARKAGARVLTGGKRPERSGDFYEPTVIADADHSMKVMREETFGPVIPVMRVADAEEAVRLANDSPYGLSASVFSGDTKEGERIARRIEAGSCNVNDVLINYSVLEVPMGGWKTSGIGYRHGAYGIRKFCRTESLTIPRGPQTKSELLWFPYTPRKRKIVSGFYRLINARGIRNRLGL